MTAVAGSTATPARSGEYPSTTIGPISLEYVNTQDDPRNS
jgi:hypothetical protein